MLAVTDLTGQVVPVTTIQQINRKRKVNGDREISFVAVPEKERPASFAVLDNENTVDFLNDLYVIKDTAEKSLHDVSIKTLQAVNEFTDIMINCFQYEIFSGSQTFFAALTRVFDPTPYEFSIVDPFLAEEFENFGRENCLSLFEKVLERYGAEFRVEGNRVYLEREIGKDTGIQFRWKHNIQAIDKQISTRGLATVIRGYGGKPNDAGTYPIEIEHRSDNEAIFGEKHADPVYSEPTSTEPGMRARLIRELIDEPQLSITVDIAALGLENGALNEGDRVFIVYEPMNITIKARVVELGEVFKRINGEWTVVATAVTLSNIQNRLSDVTTRFSQTTKRVDRLFEGRESLPYNVLPEAVRIAAEAINNSMTEIQYPPGEGIVLVDPENEMNRVRLTSAGIGLSIDGGITYRSALTGAGIVTNELVAGIIRVNNIQIVGEDDLFFWNGEGLFAYNPDDLTKFVRLTSAGMYIAKGALTVERPDGYKVINDGKMNSEFTVFQQLPHYNPLVNEDGGWWTTTETTPANCGVFFIRHDGRYLKLRGVLHTDDTGLGSRFSVYENGRGGELLAQATSYNTNRLNAVANPIEITIDLGVPDGSQRGIYLRLNTNTGGKAFGQLYKIWQEG